MERNPPSRKPPDISRLGMNLQQATYTPAWNLLLITAGSVLFSVGAKGIVIPQEFITSGLFGTGLLVYYHTGLLTPALWFLLFNIPLFAASWRYVSRRFFLYSIYATVTFTVAFELIEIEIGVQNQVYAALAGGFVCGAGHGLILRSLGSGGGLDVLAILLNQKFSIGVGKFYFAYNMVLYTFSLTYLSIDLFIASILLMFITTTTMEYVLAMFSQRKLVYIISDKSHELTRAVTADLQRGATLIKARGAYTGKDKEIIMTITNNVQLKRLEEMVFTIDPAAFFIVENTFNVIGLGFSRRKIY